MVETFSGIGAQAKALENIKIKHGYEYIILNTVEWDINAIIAYDLIHNEYIDNYENVDNKTYEELLYEITKYSFSFDGKTEVIQNKIEKLDIEVLKRLYVAIKRTNNLVNIKDVKGKELSEDMNILTYSFPCQDLSVAGFWHGNKGGIDRNANNRSSILWEVERILQERKKSNKKMPKFLLMENVRNITSKMHRKNFEDWQKSLEKLGYKNKLLSLNAQNFGIPQKRERVFMISYLVKFGDAELNVNLLNDIEEYFKKNNLEIHNSAVKPHIKDFIKLEYENPKYKAEADFSQPNNTPSRIKIRDNNVLIYENDVFKVDIIPTITTKQDRHPNSGIIQYKEKEGKCGFRYLSPRECFLLMGFSESDYDRIIDNNFCVRRNRPFFNGNKLIKMAGNSIVVNVLEEIFIQINNINDKIYIERYGIED